MRVEIWSDVVCPWCYIGKRRFETALANLGESVEVEYVYRPYQLDPTASPGRSQPVSETYAKKFGGPERAAEIIGHVTKVAAEAGIEFNMDKALRANTLLCHRALWYAESIDGPQAALKERFMQAYFTDGEDIGDPDVVVRCAGEVGIDAEALRRWLDEGGGIGEVNELLAQAHAHGITAVPTFVVEGQWAIPGAQDVEVFERVFTKLASNGQSSADDGSV